MKMLAVSKRQNEIELVVRESDDIRTLSNKSLKNDIYENN